MLGRRGGQDSEEPVPPEALAPLPPACPSADSSSGVSRPPGRVSAGSTVTSLP